MPNGGTFELDSAFFLSAFSARVLLYYRQVGLVELDQVQKAAQNPTDLTGPAGQDRHSQASVFIPRAHSIQSQVSFSVWQGYAGGHIIYSV